MKMIIIAAASVLALSGIVQARAESNGLAEVERPATTGTVLRRRRSETPAPKATRVSQARPCRSCQDRFSAQWQ